MLSYTGNDDQYKIETLNDMFDEKLNGIVLKLMKKEDNRLV